MSSDPAAISFDRLEQVERSLPDPQASLDAVGAGNLSEGIRWLASLRTGKKGTKLFRARRHPLQQARPGVWLPQALPTGAAARATDVLCRWLEMLRVNRPYDYTWPLQKWRRARNRKQGGVDRTWIQLIGRRCLRARRHRRPGMAWPTMLALRLHRREWVPCERCRCRACL